MKTVTQDFYESSFNDYSQESFNIDINLAQAILLEKQIEALKFYDENRETILKHNILDNYYYAEAESDNKDESKEDNDKETKEKAKDSALNKTASAISSKCSTIVSKLNQFLKWIAGKLNDSKDNWSDIKDKISNISNEDWDKIKPELQKLRESYKNIKNGGFKLKTSEDAKNDTVIGNDKFTVELVGDTDWCAVQITDIIRLMDTITSSDIINTNFKSIESRLKESCDNAKSGIVINIDTISSDYDKLKKTMSTVSKVKNNLSNSSKKLSSDSFTLAKSTLNNLEKVVSSTINLYGRVMEYREAVYRVINKFCK